MASHGLCEWCNVAGVDRLGKDATPSVKFRERAREARPIHTQSRLAHHTTSTTSTDRSVEADYTIPIPLVPALILDPMLPLVRTQQHERDLQSKIAQLDMTMKCALNGREQTRTDQRLLSSDYIPFRLPVELTGPTPNPSGYVLVHAARPALDLDCCVYSRVVRVGAKGSGGCHTFTRSICHQFLPQPPGSAHDFLVPLFFDTRRPVNTFIMPPMDFYAAFSAVTCDPAVVPWTVVDIRHGHLSDRFLAKHIPQEEAFIDLDDHKDDIFCTVFLTESHTYEAVWLFSSDGCRMIHDTTAIYAPNAWRHGAEVLANRGPIPGNKSRLLCRLKSGDLVQFDVDTRQVGLETGWAKIRANGQKW
ncbi:hypothetical protein C8R47DRAFT_1067795 [Mycena vitilis]|nr:hypothetical protein C8R47DRAFT_1067795 [Mycena vitilis]